MATHRQRQLEEHELCGRAAMARITALETKLAKISELALALAKECSAALAKEA